MALVPGERVGGGFAIVDRVAVGGMGAVYAATQLETGERVAFKVIERPTRDDLSRFEREAAVLALLHHPSVVGYRAHGRLEGGEPFLAMEWIEGMPLTDRLLIGHLAVDPSVALTRGVCDGLSGLHERGLIHRDIKPSNILLRDGDPTRPVLVDLGLVRPTGQPPDITAFGAIVGTPAYMSPEQARSDGSMDDRTDIFAVGCVLFEALTGQRAFEGSSVVSVLCKVLIEEPPWVSDLEPTVPSGLAHLVRRMLAKDRERRPRSVADVLRELDEIERGETPQEQPSLGGSERRYHSVVLAQPHASLASRPDAEAALGASLDGLQVGIEWMVDGSVLAIPSDEGSPIAQANAAAAVALDLRDRLPMWSFAVATAKGTTVDERPVGEVIDHAAELLAIAADRSGSSILVDSLTGELLGTRFETHSDNGVEELVGLRQTPSSRPPSEACVGRARELGMLRMGLEECTDEASAAVTIIVGPAGIGKSRLVEEAIRAASGVDALVLVGRGHPVAAGTFSSAVTWLTSACSMQASDDVEQRRRKLYRRLHAVLSATELERVHDFLSELLGIALPEPSAQLRSARRDAALLGDQLRRAFADWIAAEAEHRTVFAVLEDLQWVDVASMKLVGESLVRCAETPLMLVGTCRSEARDRLSPTWAQWGASEISLAPLSKRAAERLVTSLAPELDEDALDMLIERGDGNPFFLKELALSERRARARDESEREAAPPASVMAMLEARLDELDPEERRVLRACSLFGPTFEQNGIHTLLTDLPRARLQSYLSELSAHGIIVAEEYGREGLRFAHDLWREAAYSRLTEDDLRLGHRLAAEWLSSRAAPDPLVVAVHFEKGGRPEEAAAAYARAAAAALAGNDHDAAIERCHRGQACGVRGAIVGRLLRLEAEAHKWRGDNAAVERCASEAMAHVEPDSEDFFAVLGEAAAARGKLRRLGELKQLANVLLRYRGDDRTDITLASRTAAAARVATQLTFSGETGLADEILRSIGPIDEESDPALAGWVYEARAIRAGSGDDPAGRIMLAQRAAERFDAAGDLRNAALQRNSVGFALNEAGDYDGAERALRAAIALSTTMHLDNAVAIGKAQLGRALARQRLDVPASELLTEAAELLHRQGNPLLQGSSLHYHAWLLFAQGRLEEAASMVKEAIEVLKAVPIASSGAVGLLSRITLAQGDPDEAWTLAREALELMKKVGRSFDESTIRLAFAESALQDHPRRAPEAIRSACERLHVRAKEIGDSELRRCFLAVEENARTLSLAEANRGED